MIWVKNVYTKNQLSGYPHRGEIRKNSLGTRVGPGFLYKFGTKAHVGNIFLLVGSKYECIPKISFQGTLE